MLATRRASLPSSSRTPPEQFIADPGIKSISCDPLLTIYETEQKEMIKCLSESNLVEQSINFDSETFRKQLEQKTSIELAEKTRLMNLARYKNMLAVPRDLHSAEFIVAVVVKGYDQRSGSKKSTVYNIEVSRENPSNGQVDLSYIFRTFAEIEGLNGLLESIGDKHKMPSFPPKNVKPITLFHKTMDHPTHSVESDRPSSKLAQLLSPSKSTLKAFKDQKIYLISRLNVYFELLLQLEEAKEWARDPRVDSFFRQSLEDINDESFYLKIARKSGVDLLKGRSK